MPIIRISSTGNNYKREFFTRDFWDSVATKLVATFISVKVWGLIVTWVLSSLFLIKGFLDGGEWVTVNGTVSSVIFGARELFKIASVRQYLEYESPEDEEGNRRRERK